MENDDKCLEFNETGQLTEHAPIEIINNDCKIDRPHKMRKFGVDIRNAYLKCLKEIRFVNWTNLKINRIDREII